MKSVLLLLDYSGVLAVKELRNDLIWREWARLSNIPFDDCDYPRYIEGASREDAIKYFTKIKGISNVDLEKLLDNLIKAINTIKTKYPEIYHTVKPAPGTKKLLEYISKHNNIKAVIISSSSKNGIYKFFKEIYPEYNGFIDVFITYEAIKSKNLRNKPYPDVYIEAIREYNGKKYDKIVIVEDSLQTIKHIRKGIEKNSMPYKEKIEIVGVIHDINKCVKDEISKYSDYTVSIINEPGIYEIIKIIES